MVKASSLKHVPMDPFADEEGIPFTLTSSTAASYLSLKYPAWAVEALGPIGLLQLSPREFLRDLNSAITEDPTTFRTKRSATWHSQLAETLVKLTTEAELMPMIQDICLIPLHDGNWTSARDQTIFFSKSGTSLEIPSGIEVLVVDSSVESDPNRRKLFAILGVKAWEAPEICRLILGIHESSNFDPKMLAVDQLIGHAAFLYNASWQPPKTADLWFATMQGERCLGRKLYIPGSIETDSPAARIFAQLQKKYAVIHKNYLKAFALDADWPVWLANNLGLSMVPHLITPHVDPKPQPTQTFDLYENTDLLEKFDFAQFVNIPGTFRPGNFEDFSSSPAKAQDVTKSFPHPVAPTPGGALEDYQMKLMLLEQQNKKRLLMARPEQDAVASGIHLPSTAAMVTSPIESSPPGSLEFQRSREDKLEGRGRIETAGDANWKETPVDVTPPALVGDAGKTFALSEEFTYMFRECFSSDVLQLLRDHWQHYSQWIDGAHMKWQNTAFCKSSEQLRKSLGSCLVKTARGSLPLQETVVPMIDPQLDKGGLIPAVDIKDPLHLQWALLGYFDVIMKADIHYYLRCLIAISEEHRPDVDDVAYIYERIQASYKENEERIR